MESLINIALSQYGVTEKEGELDNPIIVNYFKEIGYQWVKDDAMAWCSAFVNWVAQKAGKPSSGKLNARSWLRIGEKVNRPKVGDIVVFWREAKNSWKGHVGFFVGYSPDRQKIYCLGGNQNNQVNIRTYPTYRLLGFRRL